MAQPFQAFGATGSTWVPTSVPQNAQPSVFVPPPAQAAHPVAGPSGSHAVFDPFGGGSPFLTGMAGDVLKQQGESYLQRGRLYVSNLGFLSGGTMHYHFSITPSYVQRKLLMLLAPFLRRWTYARSPEHISGGHKYLPPRQDVNAPDLYIPFMALWTYCMLVGIGLLARGGFRPEAVYNAVTSALVAWGLHTLVLRAMLWSLGAGAAAPALELAAYAGYPWVGACATLAATLLRNRVAYHVVWVYASFAAAVFLVRTMKRVILQESRTYNPDSKTHNYVLLGLGLLQFPLMAWLGRLPRA
ncbi:HRF1 [Auxenochlorella protothecoides x Auxenochlorella symbiontica]